MPIFLKLDQIPFWLIVLTIGIIWWLRKLWSPLFNRIIRTIKNDLVKEEQDETVGIETMYRQELFQFAQSYHLASDLFPLSEITIPPKLQIPTPDYDTENPISHLPITNEIIPFMPDMPELAAFYNSPTIRLEEAVELGLNIGLIGKSGSGKTHALNYLAIVITQRNPRLGKFTSLIPIYLHAADMLSNSSSQIKVMTKSWEDNRSILNVKELQSFFEINLINRNVIFLIDGLDELTGTQSEKCIETLQDIRSSYPGNKFVVSLSPFDLTALEPLNLYPLSLAYWNEKDNIEFSEKWNTAWKKTANLQAGIDTKISQTPEFISRKLLLEKCKGLSPFETTLNIWGLYSGRLLGSKPSDALDSYIQNQTHKLKNSSSVLEAIAEKLYDQQQAYISINKFNNSEKNLVPALINRSILKKRAGNQIGFAHTRVLASFAARNKSPQKTSENLQTNITWEPNHLVHEYSALSINDPDHIDQCFRMNKDNPTRIFSLKASRWLQVSPDNETWLPRLLQLSSVEIQNQQLPFSLRIRILTALAFSNIKDVQHLFRRLIKSDDPINIILGLIGTGVQNDQEIIDQISDFLFHEQPFVNQTASLVLIKLNTKESIEKLAQGFLNTNDSAKIIIAEALASNDTSGYQILRDGTEMNNPAVRRAAVFGLSRIKQDWARELIEELSQDDQEWLVRIAAADALSLSSIETWKYPKPVLSLEKSPWLINFAADLGVGVEKGKAAWELAESAVSQGNLQQKLSALNVFNKVPYKAYNLSSELIELLSDPDLTLNERAYNLLLSLQSLGIKIKK